MAPRETYVPAGRGRLYCRDVGAGRPVIVLHGGPEFDHSYLLPELDVLAQSAHLVYYDQRGRGRSAADVRPEAVSLQSEIDDLDRVRAHFGLDAVAVLGHSWGGLLAMEYAIRHPGRVSHLLLMNTAPASAADWRIFRQALARRRPARDAAAMEALRASSAYAEGDPETEAEYCRSHFRMTVRRPDVLESLVARLRASFTAEGVLVARAIEQRLSDDTRGLPDYDLFPALRRLDVPTLVLHGEDDFIPVELAARIAQTVPGAGLSVLAGRGHFAYVECPEAVRDEIASFLGTSI